MTRLITIVLFILVIVVSLAAAGCSSSDDTPTNAGSGDLFADNDEDSKGDSDLTPPKLPDE